VKDEWFYLAMLTITFFEMMNRKGLQSILRFKRFELLNLLKISLQTGEIVPFPCV
jgi:hypothetical protein